MALTTHKNHIPAIYRIVFTIIDPLIASWGAYLNLFTPAFAVNAVVPATLSPDVPLHHFLNHQIAGGLLVCVVSDIFLLMQTSEIWIWKRIQAGQLLYDFVILWSTWYSLGQQGRLSVASLRVEDWGGIAIVGTVAVLRTAFCLGIGLTNTAQRTKRS